MKTRADLGELLLEKGLIDLPAVEVGVAEGRFSEEILGWGVPFLYLVDLWAFHQDGLAELSAWSDDTHEQKLAEAIERLSHYEGKYSILRGWAHEMCKNIPNQSLGFVYIDASHDYENVLRDLNLYWPKLVANGVMAGHDWPIHGVQKAVKQFAKEHDLEIHLLTVNENDASFWLERK